MRKFHFRRIRVSYQWWHYLLIDLDTKGCCTKWEHIKCRMKGHPNGIVYINPGGYEPDTTCKDCGEELG